MESEKQAAFLVKNENRKGDLATKLQLRIGDLLSSECESCKCGETNSHHCENIMIHYITNNKALLKAEELIISFVAAEKK